MHGRRPEISSIVMTTLSYRFDFMIVIFFCTINNLFVHEIRQFMLHKNAVCDSQRERESEREREREREREFVKLDGY